MTKTTEQREWLMLIRAPGLGGRRLIDLLEAHDSIGGLCRAVRRRGDRLGLDVDALRAVRNPDTARIEADLQWLAEGRRHLLGWEDERYPALLRRIGSPPAALFVDGDPDVLWLPQLAMVGSRNPSAGGLDHAHDFSREMSRHGLVITSGLASGIDRACHEAALSDGGKTIAVTGTGLDRVYPASSEGVARRIPAQGALVSEFPPGTPARRQHFPSRNRIIAGLSLGVLVVEAGLNSGSLITARQAAEQGKEVFALPGSLHNPMVRGCHRLIKQGARLVENSGDMMEALAPLAGELAGLLEAVLQAGEQNGPVGPASNVPDDPDYQRLWNVLAYDPKSVDILVAQSGLSVRAVSSMLLMLEMRGLIDAHPGAAYSRK